MTRGSERPSNINIFAALVVGVGAGGSTKSVKYSDSSDQYARSCRSDERFWREAGKLLPHRARILAAAA